MKHFSVFLLIIFFIFLTCCSNQKYNDDPIIFITSALDIPHLKGITSLEAVFGQTLFVEEGYVKFKISNHQDVIYNGIRSEVAIDFPFTVGEEVIYNFEMFLSENFTSDPKGRWSILAQWHDQPDPSKGEKWLNFPARSPLVYIFDIIKDGEQRFGIKYGNDLVYIPIELGKWNFFSFHFKWSPESDGLLKFKMNDIEYVFRGANMHNNYQHYLKIGLYRHPSIVGSNYIYFRKLKLVNLSN